MSDALVRAQGVGRAALRIRRVIGLGVLVAALLGVAALAGPTTPNPAGKMCHADSFR